MTPAPDPSPGEALATLRGILKHGDTVHCIQRHTSRSGASRSVSLVVPIAGELVEIDEFAALALRLQLDRKHGGIRVYSTCEAGIYADAGATLVSSLAAALGFALAHRQV